MVSSASLFCRSSESHSCRRCLSLQFGELQSRHELQLSERKKQRSMLGTVKEELSYLDLLNASLAEALPVRFVVPLIRIVASYIYIEMPKEQAERLNQISWVR